jgi:hypothetical protein
LILGEGDEFGGTGTYNLIGTLTGSGSEQIYNGTFNQTGGRSNTVGTELDIGAYAGGTGTYTMSGNGGASLSVGTGLYVGVSSSGAGGNGTLTVGSGSTVTVAGTLQIYPGAANSVVLNGGTISADSFVFGSFSQLHWNSGTLGFNGELIIDNSASANFSGASLSWQPARGLRPTPGSTSATTAPARSRRPAART